MKLENIGSLITYKDGGRDICLGYLMDLKGRGVFSIDGKVEIKPEQAEIHNRLLAEAEIARLDTAFEIGMRGTFYINQNIGVTTWTGVKVADYTLNPKQTHITFHRNGKTYNGRLMNNADCFNFRRVA